MNGKELKVTEYGQNFNIGFRTVNVLGVFKYIKTSSLYVIYTDVNPTLNFINYGSSHVKNNSILSMSCDPKTAEKIIKEYIYKVTNKQELDNFEVIPLSEIEEIEIISSNKLEIKQEVLKELINLTIPKKELPKEEKGTKKKKSPLTTFLLILMLMIIAMLTYFYITFKNEEVKISKTITCTTEKKHQELDGVTVEEEQVFNFSNTDKLEIIDKTELYKFQTEEKYLDFINKGLYYRYMPSSDEEGGWNKDDEAYTFKIITKERISTSYTKPVNYEEVLTYYKNEGYECNENIEK